MIDGSSVVSSVWSMDNNSLPDVSDLFTFNHLIESDWSQNGSQNRFGTSNLEDSEESDRLFNFGFDSVCLGGNLITSENGVPAVQSDYLYGIDSDPLSPSCLDWEDVFSSQTSSSDSVDFESIDVCDYSQPSSPESESKHWKDIVNCHIQWSHLTSEEQATVILGLAEYIITLSPRERGDIMKILDLDTDLSHMNTLNLFDSELFTDRKFELIQDYFNNHRLSSENSKTTHKTSTKKKSQKRKVPKIMDPTLKKFEQAVKEKESGLFKKEIVISLSTHNTSDEDIDIDIID